MVREPLCFRGERAHAFFFFFFFFCGSPQILAYLGSAQTPHSLDLIYYDPCEGSCTLDTLLSRKRKLTPAETRLVVVRVCKGLGWLHTRKNYVHLQVRAEHVMVDPATLRSWIMGVGESLLRKRMDMVDVSQIDRTVGYASPELIKALPLTCQADVWSVGSLMYRCLSGENVFHGLEGTVRKSAPLGSCRLMQRGPLFLRRKFFSICWPANARAWRTLMRRWRTSSVAAGLRIPRSAPPCLTW